MVASRCPGFHRGVVQINGYTGIQLSGLVIQAPYLYSHLAVLFLQGMRGACVYFPCNVPGIHRHRFARCRKAWGSVSDLFLPLCFVHVLTAILDGPISPFISQRRVSLFLLIQK